MLKAQIVEALKDMGIRAEIKEAHVELFGDKVTLENIDLYTEDGQQPFGHIKKIEANFSIVSYFRQEANITEVTVTEPEVWIEYDEAGGLTSTLSMRLRRAKPKKPALHFSRLALSSTMQRSTIKTVNGISLRLSRMLILPFDPKSREALEDKINHSLYAIFNQPAKVEYQGRPVENIKLEVKADVTGENAKLEKFNLSSPVGVLNASGQVADFSPFDYEIKINKTNVDLKEISRVFLPDTPMDGKAFFQGTVTDTCNGAPASDTLSYCLDGSLSSPAIAAQGFRVANLNINNLHVASAGSLDKYTATADVLNGRCQRARSQHQLYSIERRRRDGRGSRL